MITIDFETYSEAGYVLKDNKWKSIAKSAPHGLGALGVSAYSEHLSTEVICLAYMLPNMPIKLWVPGQENPEDLFKHIRAGAIVEGHNALFEYFIWNNICVSLFKWPRLSSNQLVCSMAKAMAWTLPGALGKIAKVLNSEEKKDTEGKRLIRKFSLPHTPTKKDPSLRVSLMSEPEDGVKFYDYCVQDVKAEHSISSRIPELSQSELEVFKVNQGINIRGVAIDTKTLESCIGVYEEAANKYTQELRILTGGEVQKPGELKKILNWLSTQGVEAGSLTAESISSLLENKELPSQVTRVLEIRELLSSASVKKLFSIKNRLSVDGRLRDMFQYYGARTGRFSGKGPQPQNLPNSGPLDPWTDECIEAGILTLNSRNLSFIESLYNNPVALISGCLRGLFTSAPGKDLLCSDYSAIEAVVLACLAKEQWRIDVFNTHGMIYEMSASKITGVSFQEFLDHKKNYGEHHPLRKKVGKVAELACFGADTLILTDRGWVKIKEISKFDKIHDGVEFVKHEGVVNHGKRLTTTFKNVILTSDHKFYIEDKLWKTTADLKESTSYRKQAKNTANLLLSKWLLSLSLEELSVYFASALAGQSILLNSLISDTENPPGVISVLRLKAVKRGLGIVRVALIKHIGDGYSIDSQRQLVDVINLTILSTHLTEEEESKLMKGGCETKINFLNTYEVWKAGTIQMLRLIELIMTKATILEICVSLATGGSKTINGKPFGLAIMESGCLRPNFTIGGLRTSLMHILSQGRSSGAKLPRKLLKNQETEVYDVINCGKRNRFMIMTNDGPLVAHNSGYQGFTGAWKAFGADKFMTEEEIKDNVMKWRAESPNIKNFWYGLDNAAKLAVKYNRDQEYKGIIYACDIKADVLYCILPSGRMLTYHNPRISPGVTPYGKAIESLSFMSYNTNPKYGAIGWIRMGTYGGKLTENVVQAVARDILTHAMVNLEKAGYPIVMHIHDEIVCEVLEGQGSIEELEKIMATLPHWCKDWPIKAAGGWRGKRYKKE